MQPPSLTRTALKLLVLVGLLLSARAVIAQGETFKGMMLPRTFDPPIPLVVDLEDSRGSLVGRLETESPLIGGGPITAGEKLGNTCKVSGEIRDSVTLTLEGLCLSTSFEGTYTVDFGARNRQHGTFSLSRVLPPKPTRGGGARGNERTNPISGAANACLKSNGACVAACPREDYNSRFICTNQCRRELASCRMNKAAKVD